jgi:hypothetical protein
MSAIETPLLAKARPLTLADVEPPGHTLLVAFVLAFAVIYTCLSFYLVCLATALAWLPVGLGLQLIWRCGSSKSASPMAPKDRIWLCDTPTQPMIVNAVLVFEAPRLKLDRVTELVQERIIGHPALGRFSQLLQRDRRSPTGYVWAIDPDFDVRRHIGEAVGEGACEAALDEVALQAWLGRRFSEPLPRDRPLWCVELLDCDGGTALVFRCHHAVGDGIAMSSVLLEALLEDFEERSEAIRGTQGPSEPIRARSALPEDSDAMCPAVPEEPFRPFRPSVSSEGCVSSVAPPEEPFRPFRQSVSSEECVSSVAVPEATKSDPKLEDEIVEKLVEKLADAPEPPSPSPPPPPPQQQWRPTTDDEHHQHGAQQSAHHGAYRLPASDSPNATPRSAVTSAARTPRWQRSARRALRPILTLARNALLAPYEIFTLLLQVRASDGPLSASDDH